MGALAGIGTMSIVGLTPLLMIAPLMVAGGAAVGVVAGSLVTGLSSFGIADKRLDYYQKQLLDGGYLVAVQTDDETELGNAQKVFTENDGRDIETYRYHAPPGVSGLLRHTSPRQRSGRCFRAARSRASKGGSSAVAARRRR